MVTEAIRRELFLTRVRGKYRDLLQAPRAKARVACCAVYLLNSGLFTRRPPYRTSNGCGLCSGRGLVGVAGVTLWLRLLHLIKGEEGAAFNNIMLPLWLCEGNAAYMFGPASLGLCVGGLDS